MLTGLIDLTIVSMLLYAWMLSKWGQDATQAYRALILLLWVVGVLYSFGVRV